MDSTVRCGIRSCGPRRLCQAGRLPLVGLFFVQAEEHRLGRESLPDLGRCCCFSTRAFTVCTSTTCEPVQQCSFCTVILWASACAMTPTPGGPTPGRLTPGVSATPEPSMTKNSSSSRAPQLRLALNSATTRRSAKNAQNAQKSRSTPSLQDHKNVQPCR